ncbi:MAG: hypothetical protein QW247_12180 [Pyrobaculum sp.]
MSAWGVVAMGCVFCGLVGFARAPYPSWLRWPSVGLQFSTSRWVPGGSAGYRGLRSLQTSL